MFASVILLIGSSPRLIHVPTHFYKVVLTRKKTSEGIEQICCAAFLVPNIDPLRYLPPDTDLSPLTFVVKLSDLEAMGRLALPCRPSTFFSGAEILC
jgi:DNA/RNA endonuclease G (NUC1)